ncbi:hypothetical protein AB0D66_34550 [Streptomyces sp. NPDC048270]
MDTQVIFSDEASNVTRTMSGTRPVSELPPPLETLTWKAPTEGDDADGPS